MAFLTGILLSSGIISAFYISDLTLVPSFEYLFVSVAAVVVLFVKVPCRRVFFQDPDNKFRAAFVFALPLKEPQHFRPDAHSHILGINIEEMKLKGIEKAKIECAGKFFSALGTKGVQYHVTYRKVATYTDLMNMANSEISD